MNSIVKEKRSAAIEKNRLRQAEWDEHVASGDLKYELQDEAAGEWRGYLRKASPKNYKAWLDDFLHKGGGITHVYDYDMPDHFYVAIGSFEMTPLYGSSAVHVIVPEGLEVTGNDIGHNELYFFSFAKNSTACCRWVPMYNNT